jgi:hypothetical protein
MPDPGSHAYDVQRTRLRAQYDDDGTQNTNDGKADDAANAELLRAAAEGHVVAHGTLVGVVAR